MKPVSERDFSTYPRQFKAYRWFKPLLTGLLSVLFFLLFASLVYLITSLVFHTTVSSTGYDDMDFYSAAGAFFNGAMGAIYIPSLLLAVLIVKDRPLSSCFSSMGGWRWKTFLKTFAACFVIFGIPTIIKLLLSGKTGDVQFTAGGFIFLILLMPLGCIGEELIFRGFMMQTVSSWFRLPVIGLIVQTAAFAAVHSEQTLSSTLIIIVLKFLFLAFIIYADQKLHWFDEVQYDDIEPFNTKYV